MSQPSDYTKNIHIPRSKPCHTCQTCTGSGARVRRGGSLSCGCLRLGAGRITACAHPRYARSRGGCASGERAGRRRRRGSGRIRGGECEVRVLQVCATGCMCVDVSHRAGCSRGARPRAHALTREIHPPLDTSLRRKEGAPPAE